MITLKKNSGGFLGKKLTGKLKGEDG